MKIQKVIASTAVTFGLVFGLSGCGINFNQLFQKHSTTVSETGKAKVHLQIKNSSFSPASVHVSVGTTVTWSNADMMAHTVTSSDGSFNSGDLQPGKSFSYTFKKPGTYSYICNYHPSMQGTVIVDSTKSKGGASSSTMSMDMSGAQNSSSGSSSISYDSLGTGTSGEPLLPDGNRLLPYTMENGYKVFHLTAKPVLWEVKPGVIKKAWAFNGSVPGPEIRVNEGDKIKVIVQNDLPEGTTVHWHGLDVPFSQDGVGGISQPDILPGQSWTYKFTVHTPPGTYMYHSHPMNDMANQEQMGLFGPFIVEPKGTAWKQTHPGYQDEFSLMLNDSSEFGYTINGKSYPATTVLHVKLGDKVLIHLMNLGNMDHSMHLHGFHFQVIGQDGFPTPYQQWLDTIDIAPGSTYDLSFTANQRGKWLFHCHMLDHSTSGTVMSGLITMFDVE